jgi:hypothetical protein
MRAVRAMLPSIMRRNAMSNPFGVRSACSGNEKGKFWALDVNVAAHWYMPSKNASVDTALQIHCSTNDSQMIRRCVGSVFLPTYTRIIFCLPLDSFLE